MIQNVAWCEEPAKLVRAPRTLLVDRGFMLPAGEQTEQCADVAAFSTILCKRIATARLREGLDGAHADVYAAETGAKYGRIGHCRRSDWASAQTDHHEIGSFARGADSVTGTESK
jgi:hypothetical protein